MTSDRSGERRWSMMGLGGPSADGALCKAFTIVQPWCDPGRIRMAVKAASSDGHQPADIDAARRTGHPSRPCETVGARVASTTHRLARCLVLAGVLAFAAVYGRAAAPGDQGQPEVPHERESFAGWSRSLVLSKAAAAFLAPGEAGNKLINRGGKLHVPVFLVRFSDTPEDWVNNTALTAAVRDRLFATNSPDGKPIPSVRRYITELFRSTVEFGDESGFFPWIKIDKKASDCLVKYRGNWYPKRSFLEALVKAGDKQQIDWSVYDNDFLEGDGEFTQHDPSANGDLAPPDDNEIDTAIILLPVSNAQRGGNLPTVTAHRSWTEWVHEDGLYGENKQPPLVTKSGMKFSSYVCLSMFEQNPPAPGEAMNVFELGMPIHEVLHLFGVPDLYDTTPDTFEHAGLGSWCVMSFGMYGPAMRFPNEDGDPPLPRRMEPCWASAWVRQHLGTDTGGTATFRWPENNIPYGSEVDLYSPLRGVGTTCVRLELPGTVDSTSTSTQPFNKYLLIEFRGPGQAAPNRWDWDKNLPGKGFLIWEVNESVGHLLGPGNPVLNRFWPCVYGLPWPTLGRQNDTFLKPLVGLWRANDPEIGTRPRPCNLDDTDMLSAEHLWQRQDQVFTHPEGVVIDHFNIQQRTFRFRYQLPGTPPAPANIAPANSGPPAPIITFQNAPAEARPRPATEEVAIAKKLPPASSVESSARIESKAALNSYPKVPLTARLDTATYSVVGLGNLPVRVDSAAALQKDIKEQLLLLPSRKADVANIQYIWRQTQPAKLTEYKTAYRRAVGRLTAKVGQVELPVFGCPLFLSVKQEKVKEKTGEVERNRAEYDFPDLPSVSATPVIPPPERRFTREEVLAFVKSKLGSLVEDVQGLETELGIEKDTGRAVWRCRIPTVPGLSPLRIDLDAERPAPNEPDTPKVLKIF